MGKIRRALNKNWNIVIRKFLRELVQPSTFYTTDEQFCIVCQNDSINHVCVTTVGEHRKTDRSFLHVDYKISAMSLGKYVLMAHRYI